MRKLIIQYKLISYRTVLALCLLCAFFYVWERSDAASLITVYASEQYMVDEILIQWISEADDKSKLRIISKIPQIDKILDEVDGYMLCSTSSYENSVQAVNLLLESPLVYSAEVNSVIESARIDQNYADAQWALDNIRDVDLDVLEAWSVLERTPGAGREVIVAVIDTGIDYNHPDLKEQMWRNPGEIPEDGIDNDGNGYVDDIYGWDYYNNDSSVCHYNLGRKDPFTRQVLSVQEDCDDHGTHCAGIIAASVNSMAGVKGVASNVDVKLMSLKVNGGLHLKGSVFNAIKAIKYADRMGAEVCNISWCSYIPSSAMEAAIQESKMLFVAAAGNDRSNNDKIPIYPASFELDNVLSVAYLNPDGTLHYNANYGLNTVHIAAPGVDIISTTVGSYDYMSGSSMAAPHVTGIAAMIYSYSDYLYASNVKKNILESYKPLSGLNGKVSIPGIPSAFHAVSSLNKLRIDNISPILTIKTRYKKSELLLKFKKSDSGGSGIHSLRYFIGRRTVEDFKNGTAGTLIERNTLALSKAGTYTFYLSDHAGNAIVYPYIVMDDKNPPVLNAAYYVAKDLKSVTIHLNVIDSQSGIKIVKYRKGTKSVRDFSSASAGKMIKLKKGKITFKAGEPGIYTIYASDHRGNKTVKVIDAKAW